MMSESNKDDDEIAIEPVTIDPCKTYKLLYLQAFTTIRTHLETFITSFLTIFLHSSASRVLKKMDSLLN